MLEEKKEEEENSLFVVVFSFPYSPPSRFLYIYFLFFLYHATFISLSPILDLCSTVVFFCLSSVSYDKITLMGFIFDDLSMSHDYVVLILHVPRSLLSRLSFYLTVYFPILFIEFRSRSHPPTESREQKNRKERKNQARRCAFFFFVYLIFGTGSDKFLAPL